VPPVFPPDDLHGTPSRHVLPAGSTLWRVHRGDRPVHEFDKPRLTLAFGGGRFDGVGYGGFPYLYCSPAAGTALAERFAGNLDLSATSNRLVLRKALEARTASVFETTADLDLVRLVTGPDLAAVGQDSSLLSARGPSFDITRRWVAWMREQAQWAQGIVWQSSVDMPRSTMVLFGDALDPSAIEPVPGMAYRLDDPDREAWLAHELKPFRLALDVGTRRDRPRFFINYRNDNGGLAANMLYEELTQRRGAAAFLDRRDIPPGAHFPAEILDKVRGCRTLVVVIGAGWENTRLPDGTRRLDDQNDWVRREIREAEAHKVTIVPVIVGVRPTLVKADLPEDVRVIVERQFVHIREGFDERDIEIAVDRLLQQ
jgi:hypothetical protein